MADTFNVMNGPKSIRVEEDDTFMYPVVKLHDNEWVKLREIIAEELNKRGLY